MRIAHEEGWRGVIGANPLNPGWTLRAHIPAIQALPDSAWSRRQYEQTRISRCSDQAFGVAAFDNAQKDLGPLESGKLADIVAVAGDPVHIFPRFVGSPGS
jgi:hypothetical protein